MRALAARSIVLRAFAYPYQGRPHWPARPRRHRPLSRSPEPGKFSITNLGSPERPTEFPGVVTGNANVAMLRTKSERRHVTTTVSSSSRIEALHRSAHDAPLSVRQLARLLREHRVIDT